MILDLFCFVFHQTHRYGRYNTVKLLLEGPEGHLIINAMDGEGSEGVISLIMTSENDTSFYAFLLGMSPLHISSENGELVLHN